MKKRNNNQTKLLFLFLNYIFSFFAISKIMNNITIFTITSFIKIGIERLPSVIGNKYIKLDEVRKPNEMRE